MITQAFDDRDGVIWYNGQLVDWRAAKVHVLTHGLHYASSVFEGLRAYNGTVFKLREHSQRLIDSARMLGFEIPYRVEDIDQATQEVLAANALQDAYMRPVAWCGPEVMGIATKGAKIHMAIATWAWPPYFGEEALQKGLRLCFAKWKRPSPETEPVHAKAAGLYMICSLSKADATTRGYDDALMLDYRGQVAEATGANVFFYKDGVIHTPTPDCFLNGITRQTVIDMFRVRGIEVIERAIMPDELADFEQAFLTGTAAEVTPLAEIGPYKFVVGDMCRTMMKDYKALVTGQITQ